MKKTFVIFLCIIMAFTVMAPTVLAVDDSEISESGVVFYHGNSYGTMDPVSVSGDYTLPECGFAHYDNYSFKCWRVYGQEMQPGETIYVDEIVTVDAVWQLNNTPASDDPRATFDGNGGSGTMETIYMGGGNLRLPRCDFIPPEGNQFKCWRVDGVNLQPDDTIYMSGNKTITAIWEPIPPRVYFENGGGSGTMDRVEITGEYTLPQCDFTAPDGQQFLCWLVDGQEKQPGDSIYVDGIITATALWEAIPTEAPTPPSDNNDTNQVQNTQPDTSGDNKDVDLSLVVTIAIIVVLICAVCIACGVLVVLLVVKKKNK